MEKLISNFSLKDNFWDCNPNMKIVKEFKQLYDEDGSKKKGDSSKIMWAIALLLDRHQDNPYRNLSEGDRKIVIKEDFLEDNAFDFILYLDLISAYERLCMSPVERSLTQIERKLEERDIFINGLSYNLSNASDLDSLIIKTKNLKDLYLDMKAELSKLDAVEGTTRGGRKESLGEKGAI